MESPLPPSRSVGIVGTGLLLRLFWDAGRHTRHEHRV
eukprot:COSAG03_NODE_5185_length_1322_cov_1.443990_2_plen_36_part_01